MDLCRLWQGSQGAQRREGEGWRLRLPRGLRADGGAPRAQEAAPARGRLVVSDRYISYATVTSVTRVLAGGVSK
jgi:hypothetical protein